MKFDSYSREVDTEGNPIPFTIEDQHAYHSLDETRYVCSYVRRKRAEWTEAQMASATDPDAAMRVKENYDDVDTEEAALSDERHHTHRPFQCPHHH